MPKYGFNFQWMTSWEEGKKPSPPDERALDFISVQGFNFVRIPVDCHYWIKDFDYLHPDTGMFNYLSLYLEACKQRKLHMCLNLHRAPGYCVGSRNAGERDNLWIDEIAQQGFIYQWQELSRYFSGVSSDDLSFNLINEPPMIGKDGCTREVHQSLMRKTIKEIGAIDPGRQIILDGLDKGGVPLPELKDIDAIQSCRGYQPGRLTHYQAPWTRFAEESDPIQYPGTLSDGAIWDKDTLYNFYLPWLEAEKAGIRVHVGELGCYSVTPDDIALRWYEDLLDLYRQFKWGFALWEFEGGFGIVNHGRPGAKYENYHGYATDMRLLELIRSAMVPCESSTNE